MASLPLILISPSSEKKGVEFHDTSSSLSFRYEQSILGAGGVPLIAPMTTERAILAEAVRRVDGVMLTGGDDIDPGLYVKKLPAAVRKTVCLPGDGGARDLRELILIDEIFRQRKPLLAICRGFQMVNVAFGQTLIVDIPKQVPGARNHAGRDRAGEALTHEVPLTEGSLLSKITGKRTLGVNSSHHQGLLEPAEPFAAVACTEDGIVEAMELKPETSNGSPRLPFFLGVQFHPERLANKHAAHRAIFSRFVQACAQNTRQNSGRRNGTIRKRTVIQK
jgi:putative glutamine amidotransferase